MGRIATTTRAGRAALAAAILACVLPVAGPAQAQAWPTARPIRLVIGFAPGGAADYLARAISESLGNAVGQSVMVENRAGAGSSLAADFVAKTPADGYTLLVASPSSVSVNPSLNPKLTYMKDLLPVTRLTSSPLVLAVNPGAGINSLQELIAVAKRKPGSLNYTSSGNGSAPHLGAAHFSAVAGVDMVHIPYKGGGPAVAAVVAGDAQLTFGTPPSVLPMVQAGRLKALAVTSPNRSPLVPNVPGTIEAGLPAYSLSFWYGLFVPAGTPAEITRKLFDAIQVVMQRADVKSALAREGAEVALSRRSSPPFSSTTTASGPSWSRTRASRSSEALGDPSQHPAVHLPAASNSIVLPERGTCTGTLAAFMKASLAARAHLATHGADLVRVRGDHRRGLDQLVGHVRGLDRAGGEAVADVHDGELRLVVVATSSWSAVMPVSPER